MEHKREPIKYHTITHRWGNDAFCKDFSGHLEKWLQQFSEDERSLMLILLKNFYYYTSERLNSKVVKLNEKFKTNYSEDYEKAIFCGIKKDFGVGFSDLICNTYWSKNNLYDSFEPNLLELIRCEQVPDVISIIDDYSGTGSTLIKYLCKLINTNTHIKKAKIYFVVIHISEDALNNINKFAKEQGIVIKCIYLHKSERAFKENYIFSEIDALIEKNRYGEICELYNVKPSLTFGYREIAALVSFDYNTPNNTLGVFWHELDDFFSLFSRHKKRRTELDELRKKARQNKNFRGKKIFIQDVEDPRLNSFMVYCVAWGKSFSVSRACYDFGLTQKQFYDLMAELIEEGYLEYEQGRMVATNKMKEYIFSSRFKDYKKIYYELREEKKIPINVEGQDKYIPTDFSKRFKGYN